MRTETAVRFLARFEPLEREDLARPTARHYGEARAVAANMQPGEELEPGKRIGDFRIERSLGAGASGTVFEAVDPRMGRKVAIKVLNRGLLATRTERERFRREREALAQLSHPNVVTVHSAGSWGGQPFVVTELLPGETLRTVIERGPVEIDEAVRLVFEIASGLEALHDAGLVHRDVKPENVLLDHDGRAKVADLGLVVDEDPTNSLTKTGQMIGTPYYLPPEGLRGKRLREPTVDVYALGAILFELLTGSAPHKGASLVELTLRRLEDSAPDPRRLRPEVSSELAALTRRALALDPADRFADAGELRAALEIACAPRRRIALAATVCGGSLVGLGLLALSQVPPAPAPTETAHPSTAAPSSQAVNPEQPRPAGLARIASHDWGGIRKQVWISCDPAGRLHSAEWLGDRLRLRVWDDLRLPQATEVPGLLTGRAPSSVVWDATHRRVAAVTDAAIVARSSGAPAWTIALSPSADAQIDALTAAVWLPDGRLLCGTRLGRLLLVRPGEQAEIGRLPGPVFRLGWHPTQGVWAYSGMIIPSTALTTDLNLTQLGFALARVDPETKTVEPYPGRRLSSRPTVVLAHERGLLVGTSSHELFLRGWTSEEALRFYARAGAEPPKSVSKLRLTFLTPRLAPSDDRPVRGLARLVDGRLVSLHTARAGEDVVQLWSRSGLLQARVDVARGLALAAAPGRRQVLLATQTSLDVFEVN